MSFIVNSIFQNIFRRKFLEMNEVYFPQRTNIYIQLTYLVSHLIEILKLDFID